MRIEVADERVVLRVFGKQATGQRFVLIHPEESEYAELQDAKEYEYVSICPVRVYGPLSLSYVRSCLRRGR